MSFLGHGRQGLLPQLIDALRVLPGVGPKSAQRMAFHLLQRDREAGLELARVLDLAMREIGHCRRCRTLSEQALCATCASDKRDPRSLCVVEQPSDMLAIEQSTDFRGLYFVLGGRLSPLDGIGPEEIGLSLLEQRLAEEPIEELILAISPTVEGNATAHYIAQLVDGRGLKLTRLAQGVPLGGELEYVDGGTLAHAFAGRLGL